MPEFWEMRRLASILDVPYEEQLKKKKKQLTQLLKPFCQVRDVIRNGGPLALQK